MTKNLASPDQSALSAVLPALRREARLSQVELADLAGIARSAVSAIERGVTRPKADTLRLLANGLATNGRGERDEEQAARAYLRLMRAAGYLEERPSESPTERQRPVEDLTDEEVEAALSRWFDEQQVPMAFLTTAQSWREMSPPARRFLLNSFETARQMDEDIKAAEQRDAARSQRSPRS